MTCGTDTANPADRFYPFPNSAAVTAMTVFTAESVDFSDAQAVGSYSPVSDGKTGIGITGVQVFDLADSTGRYVRVQIEATESSSGTGFSEIAFDVTPATTASAEPRRVPVPGWALLPAALGLVATAWRRRRRRG